MISLAFCVFDEISEAYIPPFFMHKEGQAIRTFADCINSRDHPFSAHPSHYTLFQVGSFDDNNGTFTKISPKPLGNGVEFKTSEKEESPDELTHDEPRALQSGTKG
nr:MAG: nonstructural protein [Microvirus sp.]